MGRQQGPPVNNGNLSTGENGELDGNTFASDANPGGSALDPDNHDFKPEKITGLSTCGMFGITEMAGGMLSTKTAWQFGNQNVWLAGMDSNSG